MRGAWDGAATLAFLSRARDHAAHSTPALPPTSSHPLKQPTNPPTGAVPLHAHGQPAPGAAAGVLSAHARAGASSGVIGVPRFPFTTTTRPLQPTPTRQPHIHASTHHPYQTAPVGRAPPARGQHTRGLGAGAQPDGGRGGPRHEGGAGRVHVRATCYGRPSGCGGVLFTCMSECMWTSNELTKPLITPY